MNKLGNIVKWFCYITVGIIVVCGANYKMAGEETITVDFFGKILFSALLTTLLTFLFLPKEKDGEEMSYLKFVLHYISLCITMIFVGAWFEWISFDFAGALMMIVDVGLVYLLVFVAYYLVDVRQAKEINRMLQEKYGAEDGTEASEKQ